MSSSVGRQDMLSLVCWMFRAAMGRSVVMMEN
jgi:hypothetical protein